MPQKMLFAALCLSLSVSALADCEKPTAPEVLDGATSDIEEFMTRHGEIGAYVAAVQTFQDCLTAQEKAEMAEGEMAPERSQWYLDEFNSASDSAQKVGAAHNEQVREMLQREDYKAYAAKQAED